MPFGIKDLKNFLRQFFRSFMLYLTYKIMLVMCMIKKQETMILSEYTGIYDLVVPKDNMLRKINELIDFSFVYDELLDKYCINNGRNAIDPILMFKYLLLKSIFDLSDVDIVERSNINILDMLINKTVEIALEKGIIKSKSIIVDATHTAARYSQKSPREVLQERSKKLRKSVYEIDENIKNTLPAAYPKVREKLNMLNETLEDDIHHIQACADADARIGHKSVDTSFFGYKTHIAMTEERIITAATITTGEKNDGKELETLITKSQKAGIKVKTIIGDSAYSEKGNIEFANRNNIKLVAKLNPSVTQGFRKKEDEFQFNKDAGMYVCKEGHMAIRKARQGKKNISTNQTDTYYFDVEKCKICPQKEGCYKDGAKSKTYSVTIKSDIHKSQIAFQESEYFKEKSKERYKIEAKNSELKHRHGYDKASSSGLIGMEIQGALAIFTVNIKRILKILG